MAKPIMVQGTTSNAGKSFLAAAMCRIFRQDGHTVAPFKSQNMVLNSFITADGLEMGRAQVMQAYQTLADRHEIIVLEGAGSPAEINLKQEDIVNMGMARMAGAPVLLCADIDKGGVFASLYGTVALLEPEERARIKGLIINNFRGDKTILDPGVKMLEELTGIPVVGVVPHLQVDLDDENSLTERFDRSGGRGLVDIAVVRLPRISNFTDFNSLSRIPEVSLRYVKSASQLGSPDAVILPGTKNTMEDLRWLRQSGMEAAILKHAAAGGAVVGICGGYQMLCRTISDPEGVEAGGDMRGMGLLEADTVFLGEKERTRVSGRMEHACGVFRELNGVPFTGYEIHMGQTSGQTNLSRMEQDGKIKTDGMARENVWGSYVHGIFDQGEFARAFVSCLLRAKGLDPAQGVEDWEDYKQRQYDLLADGVRQSMDMEKIYRILEEGICI